MENLDKKIQEYWTERSKSYSEMVLEELYGEDAKVWEELIYQHIERDKKLRILDVGTGPGLFASLMGKNSNFEVFAVDSSEGMISQASKNAENFGSKVVFQWANAHDIPFEDESFDVILMRNVTWALPYPEKAYEEWKRLLKKGGKLIVFDSNWYLRLFDEEAQRSYEKYKETEEHDGKGIPKGMAERMEKIAQELPLSKERRPAWDVNCILNLGFDKIYFEYNINDKIYNKEQQEVYSYAPMFVIKVTK